MPTVSPSPSQGLLVGSFVLTLCTLFLGTRALFEYFDLFPAPTGSEPQPFKEALHNTFRNPAHLQALRGGMPVSPQMLAILVGALGTVAAAWYFTSDGKRKPVLDPTEFKEFPLVEKIIVSPNTAIYRFGLPHPEDVLGLPIGQHISVTAEIDGKNITRSYTPTSSDDDKGHFDLLVKAYEKGNISRYLSLLSIGQKVRIRGPKGQFNYHSSLSRHLGMIAGGTGITPMLQIIRAIMKNPLDQTKVSLVYANVNVEDILLKAELDELAKKYKNKFTVYYVLNNPPAGWEGGVGFVGKDMIKEHMPPSSADIKVLLCGPPPMLSAMKKHIDELGYPAPRTVSKLVDQVFLF